MSLFNKAVSAGLPDATEKQIDVQKATVRIGSGKEPTSGLLKVDLAVRLDANYLVAGWSTADSDIGLVSGGRDLDVRRVSVPRPDVAQHLGIPSGDRLGFVLATESAEDIPIRVSWRTDEGQAASRVLEFATASDVAKMAANERNALGPAMGMLALAYKPFSEEWRALIKHAPLANGPCNNARGRLEGAAIVETTRDAVVFGWFVRTPGSVVWLEDDSGYLYFLEGAYRRFRQDVHDFVVHDFGHASCESGFIIRLTGLKPGSNLRMKTISETGLHVLSEIPCTSLPIDPIGAARTLFGLDTPLADLHRRILMVDEPILTPLIRQQQEIVDLLPSTSKQLGELVRNPTVSVIVPLYARTDFIEHQLLEFSADPWFVEHAELIYVIDDPRLVEGFVTMAETLYKLYRLPFRWVWGSVNRGFSGANNLGVNEASGEYLVFLNSDAFPQQAGWLEALVEVLRARPDIGAVGPRLVFADGSIQHAGIEFMRREELGVWVNHHPNMGLDPSLDPNQVLTVVPAVTGACLAVRRSDFDRVGGWDTGYLIGDFEDTDLCLKLRDAGLKITYLPTVQLTHLERQSFKLLGQDEFRMRVVIYNAVRHQERWSTQIEATQQDARASI